MSSEPICPCEEFIHPRPVSNPPGRDGILYRVGDFASFREALLRARPGEQALSVWRPSAEGDLALQLLEWWAYLADILTFYNERIAHDVWLRTATTPGSVERLVRLLGYRPRPGLGATGVLAALLNARKPLVLPKGLAIQSKPGPGKPPEIFELDEETQVHPSGALAAEVVERTDLAGRRDILLRGTVSTVREGETLLLQARDWPASMDYQVVTVQAVTREKDPRGRPVTRVTFDADLFPRRSGAWATDYRLRRGGQTALLFPYGSVAAEDTRVHLESIFRSIRPDEPILLLSSDGASQLARVTEYKEQVWYAHEEDPTSPPSSDPIIPIPHTVLEFEPSFSDTNQVRFGWQDVGELLDMPPRSVKGPRLTLSLDGPLPWSDSQRLALLEDNAGRGARGCATPGGGNTVRLSELEGDELTPPLRLLYNLLPVSRGVTVAREVLGSGDASLAGQTFVLQKSPLTYLAEGAGYRSTLRVWVDGIEWKEVPGFFDQPPDVHVFVTREDEEQKTHVLFGDGVHGARLPTGVDNVVASYRHGSGASAPEAGTLTTLLQPRPGLQAVRNPVPVERGANPHSPEHIRRNAPRSVLTFDRAVSADDYEALVLESPSVARSRAYWSWDGEQQRPLLRLYVGDDEGAVRAARDALRDAADPSRPVEVLLAMATPIQLELELVVDPRHLPEKVEEGVRRALLEAEMGLFGVRTARIGATVYDSQIYEACLRVPGMRAVHTLRFLRGTVLETRSRHSPGEGGFFSLPREDLALTQREAASHA